GEGDASNNYNDDSNDELLDAADINNESMEDDDDNIAKYGNGRRETTVNTQTEFVVYPSLKQLQELLSKVGSSSLFSDLDKDIRQLIHSLENVLYVQQM
ncbi:unnamed protein product, partial [Didymodactylos carnosus]